jgi:hypothetical protein
MWIQTVNWINLSRYTDCYMWPGAQPEFLIGWEGGGAADPEAVYNSCLISKTVINIMPLTLPWHDIVCHRIYIHINVTHSKGDVHPRTDHEGPAAEYSSTLSLTSALDGVGGQRHVPAALSPGKSRYPLYGRLGGPQGWSGRVRKISLLLAFDPRTVQPVASHYTDWAIPATQMWLTQFK